jgi:type I restriction-modification system DNA methylase subunit
MPFQKYIEDVQRQFKTGIAREHAYRPALKTLVEDIMLDVTAINDPAHIKCGAPDYILHRRKIDVGYIEAKDVGIDLSKTEKTDQLKRYLGSLDNLVLTDYLEFRFYLHGEKVDVIRIAYIENDQIKPIPENYDRLKTLLLDFSAFQGQTIKSAKKLAKMMAHKAKLMKHVFQNVVSGEEESSLKDQLKAFQKVLVHDMTEEQFADVYAQTIAYGLFTARLNDKTKEDFSRSEALLLIPKSNPFLRQLFSYVAGSELDERVVWIVDALCEVFLFSDLDAILKDFGSAIGQNDPMLHFYETFLAEYNKSLRKSRGVWYTPEPIVKFIVGSIDEILKTHFDLKDGIANKSKIKIEVESQKPEKRTKEARKMVKKEVHKVQLLDVATGTGTFLAEAVKQIYKRYKGQEGIWSSYVENDLLPRLHGFELLMASYAMCHMKLDLLLQETNYKASNTKTPPRVSVYLTNSLEEHHPEMDTLFASWLSQEANEASHIKKNMPIMVVFGNPPYAVSSSNKGKWIESLMKDYKKDLNERNINPLSDDYVKFIRCAEHYVEKRSYGVVAMITNNSFIDGVIHRQMRKHLLETFDEIYIYDLHGNSSRQETCPDGSKDENVFDIRQGVAISICIKNKVNNNTMAKIYHRDSYGLRAIKYERLVKDTSFF